MTDTNQGTPGAAAAPTAAAAPPAAPAVVLPTVPPELLKVTRLYEILLLLEPSEAQRTWDKLVEWAKSIIVDRHGGFILKTDNWSDSRKLAYEIRGLRRGTYMLIFFRAKPGSVNELEHDFRLDERVIRHMVVMHEKEPDLLTGRVRERVPDEYEDEFDRRRDYEEDYEDYGDDY
jgi:small subunit ribosomal protein S6